MATDPTALDVKIPGTEFMDNYDSGGEFTPPPTPKVPAKGAGKPSYIKFLAQAPDVEKIKLRDANNKPLTTHEGYLKAVITDIKLVESGYVVGQTHVGTGQYKKYDRKTGQPTGELRNASPALDYLHSHGIDAKPASVEDYESYFQATSNRQFQVTGDWSAYDSDSKEDVAKKWEDFPAADADDASKAEFARFYPGEDPTGKRLPYIEKGGKRFWARLGVKRYVSALEN